MNAATTQFAQTALGHVQIALQHAYALDCLGSAFTTVELQSINLASKQQWAMMVGMHASALQNEL